ncbi:MAG: hypothetical protein ACYTEW_27355, partial [Planctomycetota bacterium]
SSTESINLGADAASRLADELERAVRAAGGISIPSGLGGNFGVSAQGGLHIPKVTTPEYGPIYAHRGESIDIDKPERMPGGGTSISVSMPISVSVGGDASGAGSPIGPQIQAEMDKWLRDNRGGFRSAIVRTAERG